MNFRYFIFLWTLNSTSHFKCSFPEKLLMAHGIVNIKPLQNVYEITLPSLCRLRQAYNSGQNCQYLSNKMAHASLTCSHKCQLGLVFPHSSKFDYYVVTGCHENKWGKPDCLGYCLICLNGGVCDDVSGVCICPPGFSGTTCESC